MSCLYFCLDQVETVEQGCGSGSGSVGSVCFWASQIRHYLCTASDLDPDPSIKKHNNSTVSKTLICTVLLLFWLFIYEN
jgi:hypothetical protein